MINSVLGGGRHVINYVLGGCHVINYVLWEGVM